MGEAMANAPGGTGSPLRQLWTLFALGSLGAFEDSRLLELFLERNGPISEDAFAAIVRRHGPMVLGVCRRMLDNPHDTEDAFQATFLILARRASAIARKERLPSWLHGVAVRAAREIRRGDARRHQREMQAMGAARNGLASIPGPDPDADHAELIPLLDEELARLPERHRAALLACEIEGKSRRDAARQLGISEGTLSSRLARGRKLLKDRLAARGVSLGTLPFASHLPESLAISATSAAVHDSTSGAASTAVVTIAERVLKLMLLARLKAGVVGAFVVGFGSILTATFVGAGGTPEPQGDGTIVVQASRLPPDAKARAKGEHDPRFARVRGIVVDEAGKPVPGIEVKSFVYYRHMTSGMTDVDGAFDFAIDVPTFSEIQSIAISRDRKHQGYYEHFIDMYDPFPRAIPESPIKIVLKQSREITVKVVDHDRHPVAGASIVVASWLGVDDCYATGRSDRTGHASFLIPADAHDLKVQALKSGLGWDSEFIGPFADGGPGVISKSVELVLGGARKIRVRAVNQAGKPLSGIPIWPSAIYRDRDEDSWDRMPEEISQVRTDGDGFATFDWIPRWADKVWFIPGTGLYAPPQGLVWKPEDGNKTITVQVTSIGKIRGRVFRADRGPAAGILVLACGWGNGTEAGYSRVNARTGTDGTFELVAFPNQSYAVGVIDEEWTAPNRMDILIRPGQSAEGIDFHLERGTLIRGTVTIGPKRERMKNSRVTVVEVGGVLPEDLRPRTGPDRDAQMDRQVLTDVEGQYALRVSPGTYLLYGPERSGRKDLVVKDENEIAMNFHVPRREGDPVSGRVVLADHQDIGVSDSHVWGVPQGGDWPPDRDLGIAVNDRDGRFKAEHGLADMLLHAEDAGGKLGGIVELGGNDTSVVIPVSPTASTTGTILGRDGKTLARTVLTWGIRVWSQDEHGKAGLRTAFGHDAETDGQGRFILPGMVVGHEYEIGVPQGKDDIAWVVKVKPEKPGTIDLGTLRIGAGAK